jgi:hypothetical protein
MNKRLRCITVFFVIISFSVFLFGCKHETIKFYRESAASSLVDKFKNEETNRKKSTSGIIILRDDTQKGSNEINFGPRDINFDMPVRFK